MWPRIFWKEMRKMYVLAKTYVSMHIKDSVYTFRMTIECEMLQCLSNETTLKTSWNKKLTHWLIHFVKLIIQSFHYYAAYYYYLFLNYIFFFILCSAPCNPNPCKNKGECNLKFYSGRPSFWCSCKQGFVGNLCEKRK